ncbi:hypothetical protein [Nostoc sp.]|uniref:hypothetical protein n=1 Tax=Nostoc sp. TaxID=1180 RepID=UPI002FF71839
MPGNHPDEKLKLSVLPIIWLFPVHFQLPCEGSKGWSSGLDEPGTPLAPESLAIKLPLWRTRYESNCRSEV